MIFDPKDMLRIMDVRSTGYYKIKHNIYSKIKVNILDLNQKMYFVDNTINL